MVREHGVEANTGNPMVAYHETITGSGEGEHTFDRDIGGRQFANIALRVQPRERGEGVSTAFDVSTERVPAGFRNDVEEGIQDAVMTGVLARYPVTDLEVVVTGGRHDPETSSDVAFRTAAVMALRDAVMAAQPAFLEPIMLLEIVTPAEYMGDVMGDLNGRRGKIMSMTARGDAQIIRACVPLAELFGYATVIRSLTRGRASYTLEPEAFDVVPKSVKESLLKT